MLRGSQSAKKRKDVLQVRLSRKPAVPEADRARCSLCSKKFKAFRTRRHECQSCWRVVCDSCSSHKVQVVFDNESESLAVDEAGTPQPPSASGASPPLELVVSDSDSPGGGHPQPAQQAPDTPMSPKLQPGWARVHSQLISLQEPRHPEDSAALGAANPSLAHQQQQPTPSVAAIRICDVCFRHEDNVWVLNGAVIDQAQLQDHFRKEMGGKAAAPSASHSGYGEGSDGFDSDSMYTGGPGPGPAAGSRSSETPDKEYPNQAQPAAAARKRRPSFLSRMAHLATGKPLPKDESAAAGGTVPPSPAVPASPAPGAASFGFRDGSSDPGMLAVVASQDAAQAHLAPPSGGASERGRPPASPGPASASAGSPPVSFQASSAVPAQPIPPPPSATSALQQPPPKHHSQDHPASGRQTPPYSSGVAAAAAVTAPPPVLSDHHSDAAAEEPARKRLLGLKLPRLIGGGRKKPPKENSAASTVLSVSSRTGPGHLAGPPPSIPTPSVTILNSPAPGSGYYSDSQLEDYQHGRRRKSSAAALTSSGAGVALGGHLQGPGVAGNPQASSPPRGLAGGEGRSPRQLRPRRQSAVSNYAAYDSSSSAPRGQHLVVPAPILRAAPSSLGSAGRARSDWAEDHSDVWESASVGSTRSAAALQSASVGGEEPEVAPSPRSDRSKAAGAAPPGSATIPSVGPQPPSSLLQSQAGAQPPSSATLQWADASELPDDGADSGSDEEPAVDDQVVMPFASLAKGPGKVITVSPVSTGAAVRAALLLVLALAIVALAANWIQAELSQEQLLTFGVVGGSVLAGCAWALMDPPGPVGGAAALPQHPRAFSP